MHGFLYSAFNKVGANESLKLVLSSVFTLTLVLVTNFRYINCSLQTINFRTAKIDNTGQTMNEKPILFKIPLP